MERERFTLTFHRFQFLSLSPAWRISMGRGDLYNILALHNW